MNQLQHEQYTGKGGIAVGTALCLGHKNAFARFHHCSGLDGGTGGLAYWHRFSGEGGLVHHGFALQYHAVQRYRQHGDGSSPRDMPKFRSGNFCLNGLYVLGSIWAAFISMMLSKLTCPLSSLSKTASATWNLKTLNSKSGKS